MRLDAVRPTDDFFALGGHSISAASALARLGEELGFALPVHALFVAPTPAEMAELIDELQANPAPMLSAGITPFVPGWVVPLQREGRGRPIFDFPSSHNQLHALAQDARIAALVGRDHPIWGFQGDHPELERIREDGVPALAAAYVEQMRVIQGAGPYLLFATCGGGYLAWEVARRLLAAGEAIAGIFFFEVPPRSDFDTVLSEHTPAGVSSLWRPDGEYRPQALQTDLTFLMTE
ncbi:MAG: thioesterase domain-containing protein, partial [Thermomicrobiales bacterium]